MLPDCCLLVALLVAGMLILGAEKGAGAERVCRRLDSGWRFHRGEVLGAQAPDLDESEWRAVDLPHDWSVEDLPPEEGTAAPGRSGPFDPQSEGGGAVGFTVGGIGWYRNRFELDGDLRDKHVSVLFDGIYMDSQVWINGHNLGAHPYGYTAFHLDLTPYLRTDASNLLAVRVNASGKTSRWFPGAGIYRHVWLVATGPVHVAQWGVAVTAPEVSAENARVRVATEVCNEGMPEAPVTVVSQIVGPDGSDVATASSEAVLGPGHAHQYEHEMRVSHPALWSPDSPWLYRLVTQVLVGGRLVDRVETPFGIRTFTLDAERGFVLNGQPLKLRGGCMHHDNGPLGACAYDRAEERRVELLKAAGFNAVRTAHNPPSSAFLDACDRLGMLVMDEAFDCWRQGKNPEDYHRFFQEWWRRDIEAMVLRDRNHPCVFAWSIGNEVVEQQQGSAEGAELAAMLAEHVRQLDPTRPVAIGAHPGTDPWEQLDPLFAHLDLCGYNYKWERYAPDHERVPERVIVGTESFPSACFDSWMATVHSPWVIGDFVWTAFDYLGEVALGHTHYEGEPNQYAAWPWIVANCGDIDICGFRRPQSYYREIVYGTPKKVACFVATPVPEGRTEVVFGWGWPNEWPSWTWPGQEGRPLTVRVYCSCPQARLLLNGRDLGAKQTTQATRFTATWQVPYEPGELVAVGLDDQGSEVTRWILRTAGPAVALRLTPDRPQIRADGQDLCYVTVEVVDAEGTVHPNAEHLVRFYLTGPGSIIAVCNSNPRSIESFQQPQRRAWRGRCLAVVKSGNKAGEVRLTAEADGLASAQTTITCR